MTTKKARRITQIFLVAMSIASLMQVFPFEDSVVQNASAGSSWIQDTEADFLAGTPDNVNITTTGEVELGGIPSYVDDYFTTESRISFKENVTVDVSLGDVAINQIFGGSEMDYGYSVQETYDGGFIIGGRTDSFGYISGDFWLIKTDSSGNEEWNRTFGGINTDLVYSVQQTADGGYIVVGHTNSFGVGSDVWLIKTNSSGIEQWNQTFGGGNWDEGRSVQETSDDGYLIVGNTESYGAGGSMDAWLIRTDASGNEQWNKTFGGTSHDYGYSVQQTSDSGHIITGQTNSYDVGGGDAWLIKTDSDGNEEWNKTFGGGNEDRSYSVQQTSDGGYIIAGETFSFGAGGWDAWLIKTNETGVEQWSKTFGGSQNDQGKSVHQTLDGGYLIGGTYSTNAPNTYAWLIKTYPNGSEQWNRTFGGPNDDRGYCAQQTADGGYVLCGYTYSFGITPNNNVWLIKVNKTIGEAKLPKFNRTFGGSSWDYGRSVIQTSDGGYIVVGETQSYGAGNIDAWVIKTDSNGTEEWNRTFGGDLNDSANSVVEASNGGFIIVGGTESFGPNMSAWLIKIDSSGSEAYNYTVPFLFNTSMCTSIDQTFMGYIITGVCVNNSTGGADIFLFKIDEVGFPLWLRTYNNSFIDISNSVHGTSDGGFIIVGETQNVTSGFNAWLIKTNDTGYEEWNHTFGGWSDDYGRSVKETSDGGFIIAGETSSFSAGPIDAWLIKTNDTGFEEWNMTYAVDDYCMAYSVQETSDWGFIITGEASNFTYGPNMMVIKTDDFGTEEWIKTYGGNFPDGGYSIQHTSDNGYIIAGYTESFGAGNSDVWLIKTNDTGAVNFTSGELWSENLLEGQVAISINDFSYNVSIPNGTSMKIQFSESNTSWFNANGSNGLWSPLSDGHHEFNLSSISWNGTSFYYRIKFESDLLDSPILNYINLSFTKYSSTGTLISQPFDSLVDGLWKTIEWSPYTPPGTYIKFQLRTADSQVNLSNNNFVGPDGTSSTYYTSNSSIWSGHGNDGWIQFKAYLGTNGSKTPKLLDVMIVYNQPPDPADLISPPHMSIINDSSPIFLFWELDPDGFIIDYQLLIDDDINFGSIDYDETFFEIADGVWYWKARTQDNDGDWGPFSYNWSFTIDTTILPPENITADPSGWSSVNGFTISWDNPYDLTQIEGVYFKFDTPPTHNADGTYITGTAISSFITMVPSEGMHTIYLWLNDTANNTNYNNYNTTELYFDGTPPSSPIGLVAEPSTWNSTTFFNVTWSNPVDLSGIEGAYYKVDSPPTFDDDGTFVPGIDITKINDIEVIGDGAHTVYIWLVDNATNVNYTTNSSTTLYSDTTAPDPLMNMISDPSTWNSTNSFDVFWNNPSDLSGIAGAYYKFNSPPTSNNDGTPVFGPGINSISGISVPGEGQNEIFIWLVDNANNINYTNYNTTYLYFDGSVPALPSNVNADPSTWTTNNSFNISWDNPPDISGIVGAYYKLDFPPNANDDGTYVPGLDINNITGISVTGLGAHTIYIWLVDNASNVDFNNYNTTILYYDDNSAPSNPIGLTADPNTWTSTNSFNMTWTNPPDGSGIAGAYYKLDSPPTSNNDGIYVPGAGIDNLSGISVTGEGPHTIYVWLNDTVGNVNYTFNSTTFLYFDNTVPSTPEDVTADPNTWNSTNSFDVSWTNPSDMSGIAGAYYRLDDPPTFNTDGTLVLGAGINSINIPVSGDGAHTIYIWLIDNASNIDYNNYNTTILYYDSTAPSSPISLTANPDTWTSANLFSVSWINPVDLSGIVGAYYKLDNPPSSSTDGNFVPGLINTINNIVVSGDGQHTIYVWLQDNASNANHLNNSMTFLYYDATPPASPTNPIANPSTWTSNNLFDVSWTNPSELSGIAGAYYKLYSAPTSDTDGTITPGTDIISISSITVSGDGAHNIYIWLYDEAGNINHTNYTTTILYYDATAPTYPMDVTAIPSSWTPSNSFTISWTNPNDLSGISGVYHKLNSPPISDTDGTLNTGPGINSISGVSVGVNGQHTIYIWLVDNASNIDFNYYNTTFLYWDSTAPSSPTSVTATPISWTPSNSFTVSWTNPAELSGIAGAYYKLDNPPTFDIDGTFMVGAGITSISSISVLGEGQHTIYIWLEDDVGNVDYTTNATTILYWDATPPTSPIGISATPSTWTSSNSFTASWTNPSEVSGIAGAYYKLDTPPISGTDGTLVSSADITSIGSIVVTGDGQHTVYVWLIDNAGNTDHTARNSTILYYDGSAPAPPTSLSAIPSTWNSTNLFSISWTNPSEVSGVVGAYYKLDSPPISDTDGTFVSGVDINSISNIIVSGQGSHMIYVWLIDDAGNIDYTNRNSTILYYDSEAPSPPNSLTAMPPSWTSTNSFSVSWTNPTDYSGIAGAYYKLDNPPSSNSDGTLISGQGINSITSIVVSGDGQHPIYVWLIDNAGNINFINSALTNLYYDGTAPSSPTSLSSTPGSWTSTNSFDISWTNPSDLSGIGGAYYKLDSPPESDADGTYVAGSDITSLSSTTVTGDGQHPIYVWLEDGVGNSNYSTNSSTNLYYDGSAPLPPDNLMVNPSSWTNINSFSVSWTNPSDLTGISGAFYKLDLEPTSDIDGTWVSGSEITSISNIQVVGDGQHTIYIWLQDGQNNIDYNNYNTTILYYDSSPPEAPPSITVDPIIWSSTNSFNVTWMEPSDLSGIKAGAYYYLGNTPPTSQSLGTWTSDKPFNIAYAPEGETNIYIWLEDNLGNKNYLNYGIGIIKLDTTPPIIQHTFVTAGVLDEPITIEANVTDADAGINNVLLFFKKQSAGTYTSQIMIASDDTYSADITPDTTETMEYFIKAIDNSVSPNIAYYCLYGQVSAEPNSSNDFDITISGEDTVPPEIITGSPTGITVSVSADITITFNEAMDKSSVESAFSISPTVTGSFSWSANTLTFDPDGMLRSETDYTVQIGTTAKDLAGNSLESTYFWQFTTTTDPNQPQVIAKSPEEEESYVSVGSVITVTFSKPMDSVSTENAFSISPVVYGEFEWAGNELTFSPYVFLELNTQYTVTISSEAKDTEGYYLQETEWDFTTRPEEAITSPRVHSTSPEHADKDVSVHTQITIKFSKDMQKDITKDAFTIEPNTTGIFKWDGYDLIFIPNDPLEYDTIYNVKIDTTIAKDIDGKLLLKEDAKTDFSFTTEKEPEIDEASFWTWEYLEPIITGFTILATILLALLGFIKLRKKRGKLGEYLEKIDETYDEYKDRYEICERELLTLREKIKIEVKKGNLEEGHFLILDKKIDDYLKELKTAKKEGRYDTENQPSLDEFEDEPEKALIDIGEEEPVEVEDEFEGEDIFEDEFEDE